MKALVPAPRRVEALGGEGARLENPLVVVAPAELKSEASWFRRAVEQGTGWEVAAGGGPEELAGPAVRLSLDPGLEAEGYRLRITGGSVSVAGGDAAGAFYGLQTLRQLCPDDWWRAAPPEAARAVELEAVEITDGPVFAWRGVHLDVSRHFMPKGFVLKLLDLIAMHKCNVFHFHLTDDQGWRMPVEARPQLTEVGAWRRESPIGHWRDMQPDGRPHGGFYSTEDLREIVAYAAERHIDVLPEIDMPGHMVAAIAAYPELGTGAPREVLTRWGISRHVLNLEPETLQFCRDVLDAVVNVFPSQYVHVGGDECPTDEWEKSDSAQALKRREGLETERQLQGWFTAQMAEHLASRGKRLVGWDEILDGGAPEGAVVMSWQGEEPGTDAAAAGHDVVMAPQQWLYFDWAYADDPREPLAIRPAIGVERVWSYDPVPDAIPEDRRHHVIGTQCELWTEYVKTPQHAEYMYFPRVSAFAEMAWKGAAASDPEGPRSFDEFANRLGSHLRRLDALGVNYRPLDGPTLGQARTWVTSE